MCQYAFDAYCLDNPGNHSSPSSPSPNWHGGDENAYLRWLREQVQSGPELRQRLKIAARARCLGRMLKLTDPYSVVLRVAINNLNKTKRKYL